MTKPTTTAATRMSASDKEALEWLADHDGITIAEVLNRYGTYSAVRVANALRGNGERHNG